VLNDSLVIRNLKTGLRCLDCLVGLRHDPEECGTFRIHWLYIRRNRIHLNGIIADVIKQRYRVAFIAHDSQATQRYAEPIRLRLIEISATIPLNADDAGLLSEAPIGTEALSRHWLG